MALGLDITGDVRQTNTSLLANQPVEKMNVSTRHRSASPTEDWRTRNFANEGRSPIRPPQASRFGSATRSRPDQSSNTPIADNRSPLRTQENR